MGMGMLLRANGLVSSCIVLRTYHFVTVLLLQLSHFSVAFWNVWVMLAGSVREWTEECMVGMEMVYVFLLSCT